MPNYVKIATDAWNAPARIADGHVYAMEERWFQNGSVAIFVLFAGRLAGNPALKPTSPPVAVVEVELESREIPASNSPRWYMSIGSLLPTSCHIDIRLS
jgi:hypothetical protein